MMTLQYDVIGRADNLTQNGVSWVILIQSGSYYGEYWFYFSKTDEMLLFTAYDYFSETFSIISQN